MAKTIPEVLRDVIPRHIYLVIQEGEIDNFEFNEWLDGIDIEIEFVSPFPVVHGDGSTSNGYLTVKISQSQNTFRWHFYYLDGEGGKVSLAEKEREFDEQVIRELLLVLLKKISTKVRDTIAYLK